jgi:ABC-type uncharacterized transport system auxiliary subunit
MVAVGIFGCSIISGNTVQTRSYYILSYMPAPAIPGYSLHPYKYSLQVGPIQVQRIYNRQNILYRYSPQQLQYYDLQQWAVRPDQMFIDVIQKHLESIPLTNRISTDFVDQRPDYRLEGMVGALEKYDAGDLFFAHMAMTFTLVRVEDGTQIWDYSFDQRRQVFQPEMVYTVRGLSAILQSELDTIAVQLDSLFYSFQTGQAPPAVTPEPAPGTPAVQAGPSSDTVDPSTFEIIPENR